MHIEFFRDDNGDMFWYKSGKLHREDGPAVVGSGGSKFCYRNGMFHREDGPAVIWSNGTKFWYRDGKLHHENGPAVIHANGKKQWFINGSLLDPMDYPMDFLGNRIMPGSDVVFYCNRMSEFQVGKVSQFHLEIGKVQVVWRLLDEASSSAKFSPRDLIVKG